MKQSLLLLAAFLPLLAVDRNVTQSPYNAACNGTTDQRTGVQAAITASASGDRVVVPAGCMIAIDSGGLQLSKTNVQIVGLGSGAGFKAISTLVRNLPTTAGPYPSNQMTGISHTGLLKVSGCTTCRVDTIEFNMNNKPAAGIVMDSSNGTTLNNNSVHDVGDGVFTYPSAMIQAAGNTNNVYSNNTLLHGRGCPPNPSTPTVCTGGSIPADGARGIWVGNNNFNDIGATITGNHITDTWHSGIITFCEHCTTTNNTIFDAGTTSVHSKGGGACQKDNYPGATPGTIANNDYQYCSQGVQIENGGNLIIQDNYFHNLLDGGVAFTPSAPPLNNVNGNVQILHNTFLNVKHGVEINGGINITVKNNTMTDDGAAGQQRTDSGVRISSSQRLINGVSITHNNIGKNSQAGVLFNSAANLISGIDISNNSLTNSSRYGIDVGTIAPVQPTTITASSNCYFANTLGSIHDARIPPQLSPPLQSTTACPSSLEGGVPVSITTTSLPGGQVSVPYTATTLVAANGTAPYTWTATPLPAGLSSSGAVISGTPTTAGTTNVVITVTDALGGTANKTLPIVIAAAPPPTLSISTASLPSGQATIAYSTTLVGVNGTPPYTWTATPLPPGLSLTAATISGIPTAAGTTNVLVTLTDSASGTANKTMAIVIATAPLQVATASLPDGQVSVAYNQTLIGVGGTAPYTWTATPLPAGVTLSNGILSGTPTVTGTTSVVITVTDSAAASAQKTLSLVVTPAPVQPELCPVPIPGVPPTFVQSLSDGRVVGQTGLAFNMPAPSVPGNTLVCYGALSGISNSFVGFTSRAGEAFTQVSHVANGQTEDLWVLPSTAGSGALVERISLELGAVTGQSAVVCMELGNASNISGVGSTSSANSTAVVTGVTSSAVPDSIVIAGMAAAPFSATPTANGSCASTTPATWTTVATPKSGTVFGAQVRYAIVNTTGNYCHSWTLGAAAPWVGAVQTLSAP